MKIFILEYKIFRNKIKTLEIFLEFLKLTTEIMHYVKHIVAKVIKENIIMYVKLSFQNYNNLAFFF